MPLTVRVEVATGAPLRVRPCMAPVDPLIGSMACRPCAPDAWAMLNVSCPPLKATPWKAEALRPSSQVSICWAEMTGTPCACAALTTFAAWLAPSSASVWLFAVKTP